MCCRRFFPLFSLYGDEKDLSCCFLLLHYLSLISQAVFGGSLWNVFLTPNNPLPAFPALPASTLMITKEGKKNILRFSKRNNPESEIKVDPTLSLGRRTLFLLRWLTWKENRGSSLSLALLASLVQYRWTSNDLLPVICFSREAERALFFFLPCECVAPWISLGFFSFGREDAGFQRQPLDGGLLFIQTVLSGRQRGKSQRHLCTIWFWNWIRQDEASFLRQVPV